MVAPAGSADSGGQEGRRAWEVLYLSEGAGGPAREEFDAVLVSSGLYRSPVTPHYPGAETYRGEMLHSRSYTGPERFEGKENSGGRGREQRGRHRGVELSGAARCLSLSSARGAWFICTAVHEQASLTTTRSPALPPACPTA